MFRFNGGRNFIFFGTDFPSPEKTCHVNTKCLSRCHCAAFPCLQDVVSVLSEPAKHKRLCRVFGGKCCRHVRKFAYYTEPCPGLCPLPCDLCVFEDCLRKGFLPPFVLCLLCLGVQLSHIVIEHGTHHRVELIGLNA